MRKPDHQRETLPSAVEKRVLRRQRGRLAEARDMVAAEVPVAFACNGTPFAVMMATPGDLDDFALGFALGEGIVADAGEVIVESIETSLEGVSIVLSIPPARASALAGRQRSLEGRSGCGICGTAQIEAVLRPPPAVGVGQPITAEALDRALRELQGQQPLNALTGATHAAGWADAEGRVALVREDVGRHNALDKLIGAMARADVDPQAGFAVVTSRASFEMVMKAAQAGIPMLVAISAPTALAIALAETAGLTLVGFAREHGHVVYAHAGRLREKIPGAAA
ncbi:formate dehydrogenase accessory sulfurtransferase FdhD [Luteimonas sp. 22616]|uniref:formate dehydrogenase accessory sulfurtransferase FdhD n=1 Tax=Luteimonas sp. 22616 TaxID=3453951 RepID=UPI003F85C7C6